MCDDGFAGGGRLRRRNCAVGGERSADREIWVRVGSASEHRAVFSRGKLAKPAMVVIIT